MSKCNAQRSMHKETLSWNEKYVHNMIRMPLDGTNLFNIEHANIANFVTTGFSRFVSAK